MAEYPCTDDPGEIIEAVAGAGENAEKFDKFVNGGVNEEVQLGAGQPTPTLRNVVRLVKSAGATLDGADVSGKSADAANGGTVLRTLSERFGDFVNIKDFGAVGDGIADDSTAWAAWQAALQSGGIGYVPAGDYLVSGTVRHFSHGCIGSGTGIVWDSAMMSAPAPETNWPRQGTNEAIVKDYRSYSGPASWSPQIEVSFDSVCNETPTLTSHGNGPMGIEIRGSSKGTCNLTMPVGIRVIMENALNGDGDCVAVWGRTKKVDPSGGTNNSDCCTGHFSCIDGGVGTGICMATEHVPCCNRPQGAEGTEFAPFYDPGGVVAQHIITDSSLGMVQSGLLFNCSSNSSYGAWSAITINNNYFKYNSDTQYPANTAAIKAFTMNTETCPESFMYLGWCPKHIHIVGAYPFNVFANKMYLHPNTTDAETYLTVVDQLKSDSSDSAHPSCGYRISERAYGGKAQAPNHGGTETLCFDLYRQRGGSMVFYRAMNYANTKHQFYCTDGDSVLGSCFVVSRESCFPGSDNAIRLGGPGYRWSTVYAGTGTINTSDERVKDNIENPSEALMRAWGKVRFRVFQMKDAIAVKGADKARLHVGVIAQQVVAAFAEEGLDAARYGLLCRDEWEASPQKIQRQWVEDEPERRDDDGNLVEEAKGHYEDFVEDSGREAGYIYSIRYDEALALECAYQRWLGGKRDAEIDALKARLDALEGS